MESSHLVILAIILGGMAALVPVFMCLFFAAVVGFVLYTDLPLMTLVQTMFRSMDNFSLVVVLFFILCGNIMTAGTLVDKLIKAANASVAWLPGGLGMAGVIGCAMFGAISGSTVATVVALGGFMIPALIQNGYQEKYSIGLMCTSGNLGIIIPPSISMILWSMITNVSIEGLFLTGFVPGILITIGVCLYTYFYYRNRSDYSRPPVPNLREYLGILKECFWALMLPVVIFAGIFTGVFTANEAAVVACVYAFIVEIFIHKSMKFREIKKVTVNSAITSATLLIIVAGATCFGRYLTLQNIPNQITEAVMGSIHSPLVFLLVSQLLLFVVGMFMDVISATLILGPIFIPMLREFNIDMMHFGLLFTVNLAIGYCTPPVGVSLYIVGAIAKRDLIYVTKAVMPFLIIQIAVLFLMAYWQDLSLWLPKVLGYWAPAPLVPTT
jgi:tripartite ATP-independent transporter DctM subunit